MGSSVGLGPCLTKAEVLGSSLLGVLGTYPAVQLQGPVELVEVRVSWPGHPRLSKKKKKKKKKKKEAHLSRQK